MTIAPLPTSRSTVAAPELLAPAGDWDAMRAAVSNGANAVYFGLESFNARHRATNFSVHELPEIVAYLHSHNVKGFLTFNTLIFSDELPAAVDYIRAIASSGIDAVIVQDLGLAKLIRAMAPSLHVHGSTQMTLTEPRGIEFVRQLGVERVVLARELGISDIRKIVAATSMPLEVFVHGALCVAYSGQCLTSEALGGRSANRGQCAQACRLPYELVVDGEVKDLGDRAYLLSPQDLAAYDLIGELTELGVASFKIEGRLKSAHYVAATTATYREALQAATAGERFQISPQQRGDLEQTFSRGFSHGFLSGVNHQELVPGRFPKSRGRRIGTVSTLTRAGIVIDIDPKLSTQNSALGFILKPGDGVVFDEGHPEQDEQGGRVFVVTPRGRGKIEIEMGRGDVNLAAIATGALVWKTDDPAIRRRLEHSFSRDEVVDRVGVDVHVTARVGELLTLRFSDGQREAAVSWEKVLEPANKFPVSEDVVREQLGRLGDTPFELRNLTMETTGGPMVPKSVLNDLRRRAVEELTAARKSGRTHAVVEENALSRMRADIFSPSAAEVGKGRPTIEPSLYVLVRTMDQLEGVLDLGTETRPAMVYCDFEDVKKYKPAAEKCREAGMPMALATVRVVKPGEEGLLRQVLDCGPDAILVRNLAALSFYSEFARDVKLIGDYSLNVSNELTAKVFADAGLARMVPSYDLNWKQMSAMLAKFPAEMFEAVVHQHMPMFHMEHCVFAHVLSEGKDFRDCGRPCDHHAVNLRDRVGEGHPLVADVGCRNTVFNAKAQSAAEFFPRMMEQGLRHFRVELLRESAGEAMEMVRRYADVMRGREDGKSAVRSLRVLNQLGVTRGTLERE